MNNIDIIEATYQALFDALNKGVIKFKRTSLCDDLFYCRDMPAENTHRFTYASLNEKNEVLAICVFISSPNNGLIDVAWYVRNDYRGQGLGKKSLINH